MSDTETRSRAGQSTAQILSFASKLNREIAVKVTESPKITLSAAVLAFALLDPELQVEMIGKARVRHLRGGAPEYADVSAEDSVGRYEDDGGTTADERAAIDATV